MGRKLADPGGSCKVVGVVVIFPDFQSREAIRNWYTLMYWEKAEQEIAAAPAAERDALRAAKAKEKDEQLAKGMDLGVQQCRGARDHDGVKCMKEAKTAAQARKCRAPKDQ